MNARDLIHLILFALIAAVAGAAPAHSKPNKSVTCPDPLATPEAQDIGKKVARKLEREVASPSWRGPLKSEDDLMKRFLNGFFDDRLSGPVRNEVFRLITGFREQRDRSPSYAGPSEDPDVARSQIRVCFPRINDAIDALAERDRRIVAERERKEREDEESRKRQLAKAEADQKRLAAEREQQRREADETTKKRLAAVKAQQKELEAEREQRERMEAEEVKARAEVNKLIDEKREAALAKERRAKEEEEGKRREAIEREQAEIRLRQEQARAELMREKRSEEREDRDAGFSPMSIEAFVLDGKDLARKGAKVAINGSLSREGGIDVLFKDNYSKFRAREGKDVPHVSLLIDETAARDFREYLLKCRAAGYCPVTILGHATNCAVTNAFGGSRETPCVQVTDGREDKFAHNRGGL